MRSTLRRGLLQADPTSNETGRLAEIKALTLANREHADPAIEADLVMLRYQAFADLSGLPSAAFGRRAPEDLFSHAVGLPEVTGRQLTAENLRSAICHHGSLFVRDLIPAADVERLVTDVDRAFEAKAAMTTSSVDGSPWYAPFAPDPSNPLELARSTLEERDGILAADSPRALFDMIEAYEAAGLRSLMTEYLGAAPAFSVKKSALRRVNADSGTDWWHQDGSFLGRVGSLNIWLSLSHCGEDAPGLDVVSRRVDEILPAGTEGADFPWSLGEPVVQRAAQGAISRPVFRPGDALLFDEMLVHRTGASASMTATRYAIECWFFAPSRFPLDRIPLVL